MWLALPRSSGQGSETQGPWGQQGPKHLLRKGLKVLEVGSWSGQTESLQTRRAQGCDWTMAATYTLV